MTQGLQHLLDRLLPNSIAPTPFASVAATPDDSSLSATALVSAVPQTAKGSVTLDLAKTAEGVTPAADPDAKSAVAEVKTPDDLDTVAAEPIPTPVDTPAPPSEPATPAVDTPSPAPAGDGKDGDAKAGDTKGADAPKDDTDGATGRHHKRDAKKSQTIDEGKPAVRGSHRGEASESGGGRHRADAKKADAAGAGGKADAAGAGGKADAAGAGEKADAAAA